MSSPPDRSWMLATPIGSSAQAVDPNMPAAAVAAVVCKNLLRLTFIAVALLVVADSSCDQIFLQDRRAHRVFRIDHVAEPDPSGLAEQHVSVDLVEAVVGAHPAHQLAIGDAGGILQRPGAADGHQEILGLEPRPCEAPALDDVDPHRDGRALLDGDAG